MNPEKGVVAEVAMDDEVELIGDGDGLAVIGEPTVVERFLTSVGLSSNAGSPRLGAAFSAGASVAQTGSEIAANSGRWVKLTEESAQAVKQFGLMDTKTPGVSHAMVGQPGDIKHWIQIVKTTPGSMVTNPAMLAGAAGIMAQIAMHQQMDAITDYLATIRAGIRRVGPEHRASMTSSGSGARPVARRDR